MPSGDRTLARLLVKALEGGGHRVSIASRLRSFSKEPDAARLASLEHEAGAEMDRLSSAWSKAPPDLFLAYHPYYKAPDLIGPRLANRLGIPYVTVEASHAQKRSRDGWCPWQRRVERSLGAAALNICMTPRDREGLLSHLGTEARVALLPPFIDVPDLPRQKRHAAEPVEIITVAMMRTGDKLESYRFLAEALRPLLGRSWRLTIIGDGPARADVEQAFRGFPGERCVFIGELPAAGVHDRLAQSDLYLWPGFGEAFGLAYLEAGAQGLPAIALDCGGISSVIEHEMTGLLVPIAPLAEETLARYRSAVSMLISDEKRRRAMGDAARRFVREERGLAGAASRLDALLHGAMSAHRTAPRADA